DDAQEGLPRGVAGRADRDGHRPVPEEVALDAEARDVLDLAELAVPRDGVGESTAAHPLEGLVVEARLRGLDDAGDAGVQAAQMQRRGRDGARRRAPRAEPDEVVRAARLRARADR